MNNENKTDQTRMQSTTKTTTTEKPKPLTSSTTSTTTTRATTKRATSQTITKMSDPEMTEPKETNSIRTEIDIGDISESPVTIKGGYVLSIVVSLLLQAEYGRNGHRADASLFTISFRK